MNKEKIKALDDEIFALRMQRAAVDTKLSKKHLSNETELYYERLDLSNRISKLRDQRDALAKKSVSAKREGRVLCEGYPFKKSDIVAHLVAGCVIVGIAV